MKEFSFECRDNVLICSLHGRFGTDINESFSNQLQEQITLNQNSASTADRLKVCLDIGNVDFIASSFIRTCVAVSKQISPENFSIIHASPLIRKTFKIAGLDRELNVD